MAEKATTGKEKAARDEAAEKSTRRSEEPSEGPAQIGLRGWWGVSKRTVAEFQKDNLVDWAAALTYYGILSVFPALIVVVSLVGMSGVSGTQTLVDNVRQLAPSQARDTVISIIQSLQGTAPTASVFAAIGLVVALWSASKYVAAFIRAVNAIYEMPEGRPLWKLAPLRLALTLTMVVLLGASALAVTFTGRFAEWAGDLFGLGSAFVTIWGIVKWPVILLVVMVAIATLYWAAPNVRQPGWRWITPGSAFAILAWIAASGVFALYVANFGSYNKTYGALAAVVIFLVWMWVSNVAILLGAELDAELVRARRIEEGVPEDAVPYAEPRDTRKIDDTNGREGGLGKL
ncbi:YihY/virulence factor BrkB family protein [Actinomadura rudentiformis]|uniref:YihY/virulence factor BrkB family protein n=1 Tax=Actinomadura rudentiformis TaxID=359158 RepID=A0A6H9Z6W5_9ACTN|nr:YihY/virulence factor BrkB family protein [Actinomadura rudentiformis]KAB2350920.1 YihY/virulence factor BrkB family protein [Actinomadura rudentiformis]